MKFFGGLGVCTVLLLNGAMATSILSGDDRALLILSDVLRNYAEHSGGKMPSDLQTLRDYVDLPSLLRPESDPLGPFPDRYTFLSSQPWVEAPGAPPRQLLLIGIKPLANGDQGAIWRSRKGDYAGGGIEARELEAGLKGFDLTQLKPMGGGVPTPTHPLTKSPGMVIRRATAVRDGLELQAVYEDGLVPGSSGV